MKPKRSYIHFLEDMLLAFERIQEYIRDYDFISFKQDYKTVDAVVRNFEIIGEAAKNLPVEVKEKYGQFFFSFFSFRISLFVIRISYIIRGYKKKEMDKWETENI